MALWLVSQMSLNNDTLQIEFPEKLGFLFEPHRYKIAWGGRGGMKSWGYARALLTQGAQRPLRILCARELQNSIADSVHHLLEKQIGILGLTDYYEIQKAAIIGRNNAKGTEFAFAGLKHNINNIKSYEDFDIVWVEEAQNTSKSSWNILIPTIRKEGSEIWATFNPELETDETYKRFVIDPPPNAKVVKVNWYDNPWLTDVLRQEKDYLQAKDPDAYLNVWEGHCRQALEGAIYAKELRQATQENRITKVPYDPTKPVHTFWDLGWGDQTSIWFGQFIAFEYRVIDFYQNAQHPLAHYAQVLQNKSYIYGNHWLPHDAGAMSLQTGRSIEQLLRTYYPKQVRVLERLSVEDGINAARTIFPNCWFDAEKCSEGLQALRHYRYEVDPDTRLFSKTPLHDVHSNAADGFRYLAMALKETPTKPLMHPSIKTITLPRKGHTNWMAH